MTASPSRSAERSSIVGTFNKYRVEIMGFAALWVFMFHHWKSILPALLPNHPTLCRIGADFTTNGFAGVDIFFLLSGIGLVYAIDRHSIGEFYARRLKRVYIPFIIMYAAYAFAANLPFKQFASIVSTWSFFSDSIYTVMWFVPAIMVLYLLFPIYDLIMKKCRAPIIVTVVAIAIWFAVSKLVEIRYDMTGFTNRIPIFLLGVLLGRLELADRFPKTRLFYLLAIPFFAAGTYLCYLRTIERKFILVRNSICFLPTLLLSLSVMLAVAFVLDMLHLTARLGAITDRLCTPLRFWGKISLEFYLIQLFTVKKLITVDAKSNLWRDLLLLAIVTGLGWLLATISNAVRKSLSPRRAKKDTANA